MTATLSELALALAARGERGLMEACPRHDILKPERCVVCQGSGYATRTDVDSLEIVAALRRLGYDISMEGYANDDGEMGRMWSVMHLPTDTYHPEWNTKYDPTDFASMRAALIEAATKALGVGAR